MLQLTAQPLFSRVFTSEQSSAIASLEYYNAGAVVTFRNGGRYLYPELDGEVVLSIVTLGEEGESIGHLVSRLVRRQSNYLRLDR